ncbi:hypothetical protein LINPERHAP2_LOCUS32195 [Linum perenne]
MAFSHHKNNLLIVLFITVVLLLSSRVFSTTSPDSSIKSLQNATHVPFVGKKPTTVGGRKVIVERMTTKIDTDDYPPARVKPPMPTPCC